MSDSGAVVVAAGGLDSVENLPQMVSGELRGRTGPLVRIPLRSDTYGSATVGTGDLVTESYSISSTEAGVPLTVKLTAAAGAVTARQQSLIFGRVYGQEVGVSFRMDSGNSPTDIGVDGDFFAIDDVLARRIVTAGGFVDHEGLFLIPELFDDRPHTVELVVPPLPDGSADATFLGYSLIGLAGRGNERPRERASSFPTSWTTLTTTAATIPLPTHKMVRDFRFANLDTVPRTAIVVSADGTTALATVDLPAGKTVPANAIKGPYALVNNLKWKAGEAGGGNLVKGLVEHA